MILDSSSSFDRIPADIDEESCVYGVSEYAIEIFQHLREAEVSL